MNWIDNVNWSSKADVSSVNPSDLLRGRRSKCQLSNLFTVASSVIKPNYLVIRHADAAPQFL